MLITIFSVLSDEKFSKVPILFISGSEERVIYSPLSVCASLCPHLLPTSSISCEIALVLGGDKGLGAPNVLQTFYHIFFTFLPLSVALYYRLSSLRLIWHVRLSWNTFNNKSQKGGDKNKGNASFSSFVMCYLCSLKGSFCSSGYFIRYYRPT